MPTRTCHRPDRRPHRTFTIDSGVTIRYTRHMKLSDFTLDMLRQAANIYIRTAYPDGKVPYHVAARLKFDEGIELHEWLNGKSFEHAFADDGIIDKYMLRLGNQNYPHMKLGIERCAGGDRFVLVVDTHDRHMPFDPTLPGSEDLAELIESNSRLKTEIEDRWKDAGLPTQSDILSKGVRSTAKPTGKTVLIIDDDESMAELEDTIARQAGYKSILCRSGGAALDLIRSGAHVDLCLLDIMMPRLSGIAVHQQFGTMDCEPFPVVFVTALPRDRVADVPADAVINKPFEPSYLVNVIRSFIG